jgi:hypothetical protein
MTINRQQKNIINPYVLEDIEYDFTSNKRNLFVISAIHEYYISSFNFLPQNKILKLSVQELQSMGIEKETPDLTVTAQDLRAYSFLYPQNCNLIETGETVELELIGEALANDKLSALVNKLDDRGQLDLYTTNSSPTAILPENINSTSITTAYTKLIAILPFHSSEYKKLIYKSIGEELTLSLDDYQSVEQLSLSTVANAYINNDENVDIYDWRSNCGPGTETNKIYYNSVDDKFYFTERTDSSSSELFDQGYWTQQGRENASQEMIKAIKKGVSEILKHTGRFSTANLNRILAMGVGLPAEDGKLNFLSHLDVRPGSRWIYAVRIPRSIVEMAPENNDVFISYDEFELTPLERATVLLDPEKNKSSIKSLIKAENLVIHLPRVTRTFLTYAKQLQEEDIQPEDLRGIDLDREIRLLDGFVDDLALACIYNKVRLDDEDIIEFSFTDSYGFEYFTFNGYLMTRAIGNKNFYPQSEEEESNKAQKILNTFSDSTPTTFSAIHNSHRIYNDYSITSEDTLKPWLDFFNDYLYPSVELSAEKIRKKSASSKTRARRNRRKSIFTKVSELAKEGKEVEDFYRRINTSRNPYYQIGRAITSVDCDTGQAALLKDVMSIWSVMDSKISIRGKIRQAILLLRDEVVKDSVTRAYLTQAIQAEENPQLFIRDIEKQINEQIFCSLDVLGNVIETSFLDPKDMNPTKTAAGPTPAAMATNALKVGLQVPKGWKGTQKTLFSKDGDLYEGIVIKIVTAYLKSVAVGIGKDVIKAALGCGPNDNSSDQLDDALRDLKYGLLDLNQYVDSLDLIEIAKSVDLVNVSTTEVDGTEQITKTDPTNLQLTTLITDISNMCTPRELDQLIFGSGDNVLYELILETVTDGVITFLVDSDIDPNGEEERITRTIDPTVYGSFEFTKDKIKNFFIALGDAMRDENIEDLAQMNISPLDAYCSNLEPNIGLDRLGFSISPEQLEAQYASIAEDKINKINALCDWLKDLENILKGLEDLLNDLPLMKQYEDLLAFIAAISNMLWNCLTEWWADLWGEDITDDASPVYNLYSTQFGKDLFYKIREIISTRIMIVQMRRATGDDGFIYAVPSENRYSAPITPAVSISPVLLPYPPPEIIDDDTSFWWLGSLDDVRANRGDHESSYALRTSPQVLRDRMRSTLGSDLEGVQKWSSLFHQLDRYLKASSQTNGSDQWISNGPTNDARCLMSIENIESGGVQVARKVKNKQGIIERKTIAQYIPQPGDVEPDQESVDYFRLLSNIGPRLEGGPIRGRRNMIIPLPSRNNEQVRDILDVAMFGQTDWNPVFAKEQSGGIINLISNNTKTESISVSNYTRFIDEQIDFSFANDQGKSRMRMYLRGTNKPLYKPNDEECVTNKEVSIANAIVLSIQARLQRFFMNVVSMASSYPHWNSLGTKKLVVDYLSRQTYDDLESKGLSNVIFEYADVFKKVYVDNLENGISSFAQSTPRECIKSLVEQIYSTMLVNVSEDVYRQLDTSPYSQSVTRDRYTGLIRTFYEQLTLAIENKIRFENPSAFGRTGEQELQETLDFINNQLLDEDGQPTAEGFYYGAYYFPIGFMIAEYLIAYDSLINITRNFKQGHYRSLVEIANADDAILSSITEQEITRYSSQHVGFPFDKVIGPAGTTVPQVLKTYYSTSEVLERLEFLSIRTGIDSEYFERHLRYLASSIQSTIDGLERKMAVIRGFADDDGTLRESDERALETLTIRAHSNQMLLGFLSGQIDGTLPSISEVFTSRLNWFSMTVEDEDILLDNYRDFFRSYRDESIRGYTRTRLIPQSFISIVNETYTKRNRQQLLEEKNDFESIFRL